MSNESRQETTRAALVMLSGAMHLIPSSITGRTMQNVGEPQMPSGYSSLGSSRARATLTRRPARIFARSESTSRDTS